LQVFAETNSKRKTHPAHWQTAGRIESDGIRVAKELEDVEKCEQNKRNRSAGYRPGTTRHSSGKLESQKQQHSDRPREQSNSKQFSWCCPGGRKHQNQRAQKSGRSRSRIEPMDPTITAEMSILNPMAR
jgi:hypothetical protein